MKLKDYAQFKTLAQLTDYIIEQGLATNKTKATKYAQKTVPLESKFQKAILDALRKRPDVYAWKAQAGMYQSAGLPDICCIKGGLFYGFEVKRPFFGKLSPIQERTLSDMAHAGASVHVVTYLYEVEAILGAPK